MSLSDADRAFAAELFAGLGGVTTRRMFGGMGIYRDGVIFALMRGDGAILLKGANGFGDTLEAAGGEHWKHRREDGTTTAMPYWTLPDAALDDPELACDWARRAIDHL
ncbi:TfoX/Sxy family protein [Psychromarinibacter sp. C21-152]|uniref:TfoX/Sxy family protein n=1 Tax=Psychromarinibacter sediminicola TaxID=3033385 RepID=A0AAE3TBT6_9RHOB|nr:TfoX/Sxy family protein [Psychromarinibacter sediminicola]MDF0602950.1 TfoX/Sxy family protein [Psychromarinibacter sediminicola]